MILNKLTFESEGLIVDYVTFNFDQLNQSRKADLINHFYKLGFIQPKVKLMLHNSYQDIQDLTTFNISDGFILYEKIVSK